MHTVEFALTEGGKPLKYRYLVRETVGIIPPSRKKHQTTIANVLAASTTVRPRNLNGTTDGRILPEEIVTYVLKHQIF